MKIHSVTMTGFGPFLHESRVDFDSFDDDGIFLIGGRTGAGKSSILDALTFGLFGSVPRYGDGKVDDHVRSRYLEPGDPTTVQVEFTVAGARYRVTRSPAHDRPKKRGEGFTRTRATLELERYAEGRFEAFEVKVGNAETHVSELIGLNADQFLQVVLLAQGRFQEFLVAQSEDRRRLLRTLFRTERFDHYAEQVQDRARTAKSAVEHTETALTTTIATFADHAGTEEAPDGAAAAPWAAQVVLARRTATDQAKALADRAAAAHAQAQEALQRARTTAERQRRRAQAQERHDALWADRDTIEVQRNTVATARRAAIASHALAAQRAASVRLREAEAELDALPACDDDLATLRERESALAQRLGALTAAVELERQLPSLQASAEAATEALRALDHETEAHRAERAQVQATRSEVVTQLDRLGDVGAHHAAAQAAVARHREHLATAHRAVAAEAAVHHARTEHVRLVEASHAAESAWLDLRRRQLAGWSAAVAADLVDGRPCPVCGSVDHPEPAARDDTAVDDAMVAGAEATLDAARQHEAAARAAVASAQATHTAAVDAAGGTIEAWTEALSAADDELTAATAALTRRAAAEAERTRLDDRLASLDQALASVDAQRAAATSDAASAAEAVRSARARVDDARGEASSVEAVRDAARDEHESVRRRLGALETLAHRAAHRSETSQALAEALAEGGFVSADDVDAARLDPVEIERLDAIVTRHDVDLAAATSTLAEPELADLPSEPVDLTGPAVAAEAAREAHESAAASHTALTTQLMSLSQLADQITATIAGAADQLARYETVRDLDLALRGYGANELSMPLETFALAAELTDILDAANLRLDAMTHGRYRLHHTEAKVGRKGRAGLELIVLDAHSGQARSPSSLSGGEKFQASLALALGLAEVVTSRAGGIRLDTLFIDEGFGSLDPETLETTMETLDSLREGGRTIGLISHVEAMKEQIPAQVRVEVTEGGWSAIAGSG